VHPGCAQLHGSSARETSCGDIAETSFVESGVLNFVQLIGHCSHSQIAERVAEQSLRIMTKSWKVSSPWLDRKVKRGFRGYPVATVAFYGPTAETATKIAVGIFKEANDPFERWFSQESDIRLNTVIGEQIAAFISTGR
jgi:hypothetical protein